MAPAQKPWRDWAYLAIIGTQLFGMLGKQNPHLTRPHHTTPHHMASPPHGITTTSAKHHTANAPDAKT